MFWNNVNDVSLEDQKTLAEKASKGDKTAAHKLIEANLKLASSIAHKYSSYGSIPVEDLEQEGFLGLVEAVPRYDPCHGASFATYASYWIRARILARVMSDYALVKIGRNQQERKLFFRLKKEQKQLLNEAGELDSALLAERMGVDTQDVDNMSTRLSQQEQSLDTNNQNDPDSPIEKIGTLASNDPTPAEIVQENQDLAFVKTKMALFIKRLDDRDLLIWNKRIAAEDPITVQELGDSLGITKQRVSQIEIDLHDQFIQFARKHA
jgi:RNA polymerase sigma-32 factor